MLSQVMLQLPGQNGGAAGGGAAGGAQTAPPMPTATGSWANLPGFDQSLFDAGQRLQSALNRRAVNPSPTEPQASSPHTSRQHAVQSRPERDVQGRDDRERRADRAQHERQDQDVERASSRFDDEDDDKRTDASSRRRDEVKSAAQDQQDAQPATASAREDEAEAGALDEEQADEQADVSEGTTEQGDSPSSGNEQSKDGTSDSAQVTGLEALAQQVDKLVQAALDGAAKKGADGAGAQGRNPLQNVLQQIQQALAGTSDAQVEGMFSNSKNASATGGDAQSQSNGQHGRPGQIIATLANVVSQAPATAGTPSSFATVMGAQAAANTSGGATAQAVLEGMQQTQSGDNNASGTRTSAPGQSQSQNGANGQSNPSDLNAARLARGLQSAVAQRGGSVTLRLTPPEMGTVRIQLQIKGGTVNAQFHTQTESARQMLTQQLSQLRQALEGQGLSVERLGAQTMSQSSSQTSFQQAQQQAQQGGAQQQQQADASPDDGRSRGEYARDQDDAAHDGRRAERDEPSTESVFEQVLNETG